MRTGRIGGNVIAVTTETGCVVGGSAVGHWDGASPNAVGRASGGRYGGVCPMTENSITQIQNPEPGMKCNHRRF
jgi:hypothetical protein